MGVQARVVLYAADEATAQKGFDVAFGELGRLDALLSDYRSGSELSRINHEAGSGEWVRVSEDTARVLRRGREIAEETGGAFDMTVGPAVALWRETRRTGVMPEAAKVQDALLKVDWRAVEVEGNGARLRRAGMRLDAGGIAKGDAAQQAVRALTARGIRRSLVSLAGDLAVGDPPPKEKGWRVEVRPGGDAVASILVRNVCISTSGDAEQFVEIGGVRYSHIVDPRSGLGVTHSMAATVVAEEGALADAMATALAVMTPEEAKVFASTRRGMSVLLFQRKEDGGTQVWQMDQERRIRGWTRERG